MRPIDAYATQPHYYDHIAPIWDAIDGRIFHVGSMTQRPGRRTRGLPASDDLLIVAGYPDLKRTRRPVIFVEHGIGENYGASDPHYSGGRGRERVELFLCPNRKVYEANEARYPGRSVIVGSPRLEWLAQSNPEAIRSGGSTERRVVVSFHWDCPAFPQTRSALRHYAPHFKHWAGSLNIRGHSHPRIRNRAEPLFAAAGIEYISEFADVVAWADTYVVDNSSTLFEAAALGLDVVVLDDPRYPPEETGFRFWKYADIGPRIQTGEALAEVIGNYIHVSYDAIRRQMVTEVFGPVEGSTQRAADAINEHRTKGSALPA